jgi:hypothetical protein
LDVVGCSFALLRRVYWPTLEEFYEVVMNTDPLLDGVGASAITCERMNGFIEII